MIAYSRTILKLFLEIAKISNQLFRIFNASFCISCNVSILLSFLRQLFKISPLSFYLISPISSLSLSLSLLTLLLSRIFLTLYSLLFHLCRLVHLISLSFLSLSFFISRLTHPLTLFYHLCLHLFSPPSAFHLAYLIYLYSLVIHLSPSPCSLISFLSSFFHPVSWSWVEYIDWTFAEGVRPPPHYECPGYYTKLHLMVRFHFWSLEEFGIPITSRSTLTKSDSTC